VGFLGVPEPVWKKEKYEPNGQVSEVRLWGPVYLYCGVKFDTKPFWGGPDEWSERVSECDHHPYVHYAVERGALLPKSSQNRVFCHLQPPGPGLVVVTQSSRPRPSIRTTLKKFPCNWTKTHGEQAPQTPQPDLSRPIDGSIFFCNRSLETPGTPIRCSRISRTLGKQYFEIHGELYTTPGVKI
jgi:hypothetical protein